MQLLPLKGADFNTERIYRSDIPGEPNDFLIKIQNTGRIEIIDFIVRLFGTEGTHVQNTLKNAPITDIELTQGSLPLQPLEILEAKIKNVPSAIGIITNADVIPIMDTEKTEQAQPIKVLRRDYDVLQQQCINCPLFHIVILIDNSLSSSDEGTVCVGIYDVDGGCSIDNSRLTLFKTISKELAEAVFDDGTFGSISKVTIATFSDNNHFTLLDTFDKNSWNLNGLSSLDSIISLSNPTNLPNLNDDEPEFSNALQQANSIINNVNLNGALRGVVLMTDDSPSIPSEISNSQTNAAMENSPTTEDDDVILMIVAVGNVQLNQNDRSILNSIAQSNDNGELIFRGLILNSREQREVIDLITSFFCSCSLRH